MSARSYTPADVGHRIVNGRRVPADPAERERVAAAWNAEEAARPLQEWRQAMAVSDATITPRMIEDLAVRVGLDSVSPELKAAVEARQALRAQKPE